MRPGSTGQGLIAGIARIGADPADTDDIRLQKSLLVASTLMISSLAVVWGGLYFYFREPLAASIPLGYAAASYLGVVFFAAARRYVLFRASQLFLTLLLPFLLMLALGGFSNSSAVILWALTSPLGALLFAGPRQAIGWFVAYLCLAAAALALEPFARPTNNLPPVVVTIFFFMNIAGVSAVCFVLTRYFVIAKNDTLTLLSTERDRSETLLYNMLPKNIAQRIKDGEYPIADSFGEITILFADIVKFTVLATKLGPRHLVELLNDVFSAFDALAEECGMEKVKTIGDAYMAVTETAVDPSKSGEETAANAINMGVKMLDLIRETSQKLGYDLEVRIGMHTGPVIAGVIGTSKYQFDLWGDAVNIASRMESVGVPGRVHVSETTYLRVKGSFEFEARGAVRIKGMGTLQTYLLVTSDTDGRAARSGNPA